ncbi:MAG: hypothetical protein R2856_26690 [Caldilineaceae bacterium]
MQRGTEGAAIANSCTSGACDISLVNVVIWGNTPSSAQLLNNNATPSIKNSLIEGSGGSAD